MKEKVDILFKLGRSYINRNEKKDSTSEKKDNPGKPIDDEEIETVSIDEVTEEDLETWTKSKLRGFKRAGPSTNAEKNSNSRPPNPTTTEASRPTANSGTSNPPKAAASQGQPQKTPHPPKASPVDAATPSYENHPRGRTLYCHYFSNLGKCTYEERTGATCRFVHEEAPMCQSGLACNRAKCMYKHPNMAGRKNNFLDQSTAFPQPMNPWQTMNPWWNPHHNQIQHPNQMQYSNQMQYPSPWSMKQ